MTSIIIFCVLLGIGLGLRYSVLVLVVSIAAGFLIILQIGVFNGRDFTAASLLAIAGATALQIGYIAGSLVANVIIRTRIGR